MVWRPRCKRGVAAGHNALDVLGEVVQWSLNLRGGERGQSQGGDKDGWGAHAGELWSKGCGRVWERRREVKGTIVGLSQSQRWADCAEDAESDLSGSIR